MMLLFSKMFTERKLITLVHFLDQIVDVLFSVTKVTALDEVVGDFSPASSWARKFDWEQVVLDSASLVDHVFDGFLGWVSPSDEWITNSQHLEGGGVQSNKDGVSDLSESKKLEGLLWFWGQLVDTSDSDDQSEFWFAWNVVVSVSFSGFGVVNQGFSFSGVFGGVGSGFGDDFSLFGQTGFLGDSFGFGLGGSLFSESRSFFGETFWNSGFSYFGDGHFRRNKFCLVFFCKFDLRL